MASSVSISKLFSSAAMEVLHHDPDTTDPIVVTPDAGTTDEFRDFQNFNSFAAIAMLTDVGTGGALTKLEIVGATDTAGSNLFVVTDSGVVDADAVGDYIAAECTAAQYQQEMQDAGVDGAKYIGVRLTADAADVEAAVFYTRFYPRFAQADLTQTTIS